MATIEVVFCTAAQQLVLTCAIEADMTVETAILHSKLLDYFPQINLAQHKTGIFGKIVPLSHPVHAGDRIEVYRPLPQDPKQIRRKKANRLFI